MQCRRSCDRSTPRAALEARRAHGGNPQRRFFFEFASGRFALRFAGVDSAGRNAPRGGEVPGALTMLNQQHPIFTDRRDASRWDCVHAYSVATAATPRQRTFPDAGLADGRSSCWQWP